LNMGLLELSAAESGKQKTVEVTDAGRATLIKAAPYWERAQGHLVSHFGPEHWNRIVSDLGSIVDATRSGPVALL
jgi:hypothetical protein